MTEVVTIPAKDTTSNQFNEIQNLRSRYFSEVFEGYPEYFVPQFVGKTTLANWRNPNVAVGSRLTRSGQRFARAQTGLIYNEEDLSIQAVSLSADNASSSSRGIMGVAERTAKLYLPGEAAAYHRYRVIRDLTAFTVEHADLLIDKAISGIPDQPKTAYVLSIEAMLISTLSEHGFKPNSDFNQEQLQDPIFEDPSNQMPPVYIERYDRMS